ncbi:hypothetical protein GCM10028786_21980 [Flaviaesturariibacter terrae]
MEVVLIVVFGAILIGVSIWASRLKRPARSYYRITCGVLLFLLGWFATGHDARGSISLMLLGAGAVLWEVASLFRERRGEA